VERISDYRWRTDGGRVFAKAVAVKGLAAIEGRNADEYVCANVPSEIDDFRDVVEAIDAVTKWAVPGTEYGPSSGTPAFSSIAQGVFDATVPGQIQGLRRMPFVHQVAAGAILGSGASWRKDGRGIRVTPVSFSSIALARRSLGGIVVVTQEFA
jgi:hypothetical protein